MTRIRSEFPKVIESRYKLAEAVLQRPLRVSRRRVPTTLITNVAIYILFNSMGAAWYTAIVLVLGLISLMALWLLFSTRERTMRILDKARQGICADCGYTIASSPAQALETCLDFPHCPECGVSWPLFPPELGAQSAG
jgi:hypothetical protein